MRRRGFTMVELIVVVAIVLLLLGLLFPALAAARRSALVTKNRVQLQEISAAVENYHTLFDAYPGPVSAGEIASSGTFTGAQNLLAALTRKVRPAAATGFVQATATAWIERDYSSGPEKNGQALSKPVYEQKPGDSVAGSAINPALCDVPLFVDSFPGGLPILYYRGVSGAKTLVGDAPATGVAAFYMSTNAALTQGTIHGADGAAFTQNLTAAGLQQAVTNADGTVRGGYVLISAGVDRVYGLNAAGKSDDVVVVGGQ